MSPVPACLYTQCGKLLKRVDKEEHAWVSQLQDAAVWSNALK
jgi:hypothetical protein